VTYGDPERPLRWVSKSREKLAAALRDMGHTVSPQTIGRLLLMLECRRRGNAKADEGRQNPDRDAQFKHVNQRVLAMQTRGQPVISVDTKKRSWLATSGMPARIIARRVGRDGSTCMISPIRHKARQSRMASMP
jgi:hypothetical protein